MMLTPTASSVAPKCDIYALATIGQRELRNDNAEVIRRVEAGESFTVPRRGIPVADLTPHEPDTVMAKPRFVPADVLTAIFADIPSWGVAEFDQEQRELDTRLDDEPRDPWS